MTTKIQTLYGLKFNPFRPDIPIEALYITPTVDAFIRRVELGIAGGGYVMVTGEPGTGKSAALRLLGKRLSEMKDVMVGTIEHPQSRTMDFYRELGDLFSVPLQTHNRWGGFKALRNRWAEHIASSLCRPILILDEAQEILTTVLTELRSSAAKTSIHGNCFVWCSPVTLASSNGSKRRTCCRSEVVSAAGSRLITPRAMNCWRASTICSKPPAIPA